MRARAERLPLSAPSAVVLIAAAVLCRLVLLPGAGGDYQLGKPVLADNADGAALVTILNALWLAAFAALAVYLARSAVRPRVDASIDAQDEGRASGWRGSPSSGIGSQAAA